MNDDTLFKEHESYMAQWKADGKPFHAYTTPCCGKALETTAPSTDETWDSMTQCPYCGELYFKVVTADAVSV